ncbi:unnamed protein product [Anisakis simplex]|uniref:SET domain-containing protein n=1 Tax=Anisakis simplex TaxID=6269 RepID=A0A0M3KDW7_ANISI|nr:unnamed protein product [Anisakis simplex]
MRDSQEHHITWAQMYNGILANSEREISILRCGDILKEDVCIQWMGANTSLALEFHSTEVDVFVYSYIDKIYAAFHFER